MTHRLRDNLDELDAYVTRIAGLIPVGLLFGHLPVNGVFVGKEVVAEFVGPA